MSDFLRLRALEQRASTQELEGADDLVALQQWQAIEINGQITYLPVDEIRARLGI